MARFNLDDYETVESRLKRLYEMYPDARVITEWANENEYGFDAVKPDKRTWVMKATIYLTGEDLEKRIPKATGYASEVDGTGGANNVDAAANGETSSIGRALANMNLSGNKRSSREEMQKVARLSRDWIAEAQAATDKNALRLIWAEASAAKVSEDILSQIKELANGYSESEHSGDSGSTSGSGKKPTAK